MSEMQFFKANNINEAKSLIAKFQDKNFFILSGGTDFIPKWKDKKIQPEILIEIFNIPEFKIIEERSGKIFIGAAATFNEIINSKIIKEKTPVLAESAKQIGSVQIRNRATIGGNVANSSPAGDSIPALFVHEAEIIIQTQTSEKSVPIDKFFKGPGKNILERNEIITGFNLLPQTDIQKSRFLKLGQRYAMAISKIMCACLWESEKEFIKNIRIAFGAVAPTVIRAYKTEDFLKNKILNDENLDEAAKIVKSEIKPISDIRSNEEYRLEMGAVLLKRILKKE